MNTIRKNSKGDTTFYSDWDEGSGAFVVFGDNSGFGYASFADQESAIRRADSMSRELVNRDN